MVTLLTAVVVALITAGVTLRVARVTQDAQRFEDVAASAADLRAVADELNPLGWMWGTAEEHAERYLETNDRLNSAAQDLRRAAAKCGSEAREEAFAAIAATRASATKVALWVRSMHAGHQHESTAHDAAEVARLEAISSIDLIFDRADANLGASVLATVYRRVRDHSSRDEPTA